MKILMIAPTPFSSDRGTHLRILHEALALKSIGYDVTILTYHVGDNPKELTEAGVKVSRIPKLLFWYKKREAGFDWQKIPLDFLIFIKVIYLVLRDKPNAIHGHLHEGIVIGWITTILFFWKNILLVGDFHGELVGEMRSQGYLSFMPLRSFFVFIEHCIYHMPRVAITSSAGLQTDVAFSRDNKQTIYVPDIPFAHTNGGSKTELRKKYAIPESAFVALYTGGVSPDKGIDTLFSVIYKYQTKYTDPTYWIFATTAPKGFSLPSNIAERVRVVSPLGHENLIELLTLSDIALDPKKEFTKQGSGKMLTYMSFGLPVVCFDSETNRDYLGQSSKELASTTEDEFMEKVGVLLRDETGRKNISIKMKEQSELFSFDAIKIALEKAYKTI